jgi:hypothetical protein
MHDRRAYDRRDGAEGAADLRRGHPWNDGGGVGRRASGSDDASMSVWCRGG